MADSTINFNPAKFAGGVMKSFVSATTQTISSYMPFTSEVLADASDTAFNIKQFIAENRPDRTSRNASGTLRLMANKTLNASRTFLSDLSHGDLSFSRSRESMIGYLKKNSQSEFDFDFDFDFDDESNESMPEEKSFTTEDYVQGVYESTMATVGAIETSTNKLAYMNAKSNSILGDRLISNNMANMAQTMQMLNTVNENISGVNTNLASLVEYNNTTMNDFIKNTTSHFAKVETFMDMITKRYESEDKGSSNKSNTVNSSNEKIFTDTGINLGNLLKKAITSADTELGTMGIFGSMTKLLATSVFGADKLPKFLKEIEGPDLSSFVEMFNPAKMLVDLFLPDLSRLSNADNVIKGFATVLKRKLTTDKSKGGFFNSDNKLGHFLMKLFTDEDDKLYRFAENEKASWMSSDSDVLQHVIPSFISETNVSLNYLNSNVSAIYKLMEFTTKEISAFHEDSLRGYRYMLEASKSSGNRRNRAATVANNAIDKNIQTLSHRETHARNDRRFNIATVASNYQARAMEVADKYKDEHKLIYDSRTMSLRTYGEIQKEDRERKLAAYKTGATEISDAFYRIITKNGDIENIDAAYNVEGLSESISNRLNQIIGIEAMIKENPKYVTDGRLNETAIIDDVMNYLEGLGIFGDNILSATNKARLISIIKSASDSRFAAIDKYRESYAKDVVLHQVKRSEEGSNYQKYSGFDGKDLESLMADPKYKDAFKIIMLKSDTALFRMAADAQLLDAKAQGLKEDSYEYRRLKEDSDRRYNEMVKSMEAKKKNPMWKILVAQNPFNMYASALIDTISEYLGEGFNSLLHNNGGNIIEQMRDVITSKPIGDAFATLAENYANRQGTYTTHFDGERHRGQRAYSPSRWGEYFAIDSEGNELGWFPDEEYRAIKESNENAGYEEDDNHRFVRRRDDGTLEYATRQYSQPTLMSFATGATRIDHDQIAQVHEGEMILDKSLSENVRDNIANMIKVGGVSKLTDDQYKELVKSIGESDERFKGHEEEIIKDITRVIDTYDIKDESKVELSKESICFIDVDENETYSSLLAKKVTEIAINLGIVARSALNRDAEEVAQDAKDKAKNGGNFLFGSKNEQGMYTGGPLSNKINKIRDDFNYWRFKSIDGKKYTGFTRDETGNIIEGAGLKTYNAEEENPETIFKILKDYARNNASKFADKQGWTGEKKEEYLKSIDKLVDGVPGALKGGVGGLALSAVLGGFAPAIGMLGGFAFSNKETREYVFGKTVTDSAGRRHIEGGIFGGFTNKLVETGDEIKYNFISTFKDVSLNLKLGFKNFIDKLTNAENSSITEGIATFIDQVAGGKKGSFATKLLSGILNTTRKVADGATDIAIDAATVGSKLMFKAASLPFNAFASIIGGKGYRDDKRAEEKAARTEQMRKLFDELVHNDAMLGIDPTKHIVSRWRDHRNRLANENAEYTRIGYLQGRNWFGKGGKLYDNISLHTPEIKTIFDKISEGITQLNDSVSGDFAQNALRGIVGAVLAGPLAMSGHPVLAASVLGAGMSSAIAKQIFGTGIIGLFGSGLKLIGQAITKPFKRAGEFIGNRAHMLKEALGIHDNKFYIKRMTAGSHIEKGSILNELGYSTEEAQEYFELAAKDPSELTPQENIKLQGYRDSVARGYRVNDEDYRQAIADDKEYEKLRKNKNRTPEEEARYKELIKGIGKRKWQKFKHTGLDRASYTINYGFKNERLKALDNTTLEDFNNAQASIKFNSELDTRITPEMFASMGVTDEGRQREIQKEMDANLKKLRDRVISKYGSLDAAKDHADDLKNMILSSKLGKNKAAVADKNANELVAFLRDGNIARANQEEQMRENVNDIKTNVKNALDVLTQIYNGLKDKIFKPKVDSTNLHHGTDTTNENQDENTTENRELSVNEVQDITSANNSQSITDVAGDVVDFVSDPGGTVSNVLHNLDGENDSAVEIAEATTSVSGSHLSGAFNIPNTGLYQLHAGEMVFDPNTADKIRQNFAGAFGKVGNATTDVFNEVNNKLGVIVDHMIDVGTSTKNKLLDTTDFLGLSDKNDKDGGIKGIFSSMKKSLSGILNIFAGDKTGSDEAKKSFLDKMKDSFMNVGNIISGTVRRSGLIPIDETGKPDIATIGTRVISLIGGAILFGPAIKRVMETLSPIVQPIFDTLKTGITGAITGLSEFISPIANDILSGIGGSIRDLLGLKEGDSVLVEVGHAIANAWENVWESAGAAFYHNISTKGQASDAANSDTTSVGAINDYDTYKSEYTKYVNNNSKYSGYSNEAKQRVVTNLSANRKQFLIACSEYWSTLLSFLSRHVEMFNGTLDAKKVALALTTNNITYKSYTSKMLQNLTPAEKTFCNKAIKYPSILTNFTALYNNEELKKNFLDVIKSTSGITTKLDDNLDIKVDDKYEYQDFESATDKIRVRVAKLKTDNDLANNTKITQNTTPASTTKYNIIDAYKYTVNNVTNGLNNIRDFWSDTWQTPSATDTETSVSNYEEWMNSPYVDELYAGSGIGYGYVQNDPRWSRLRYGNFKSGNVSTLGSGGCGPTAMANVYSNLTGKSINPAQMARFSQSNGYNTQGGTSAGLFTSGARKLGLSSNVISKSGKSIKNSIKSGKNVIIAGKNGPYTKSGHIMSVRGVDSRGNAIVDDPLKRGTRRISMKNLTRGMTHAWSIGYGEETGPGGQQYSVWNDKFLDGEVTFNRNGGAFGYYGPNVGGPDYMDGACIYNSFVNGYINALLGKSGSISEFVKRVNWTPSTLYSSGKVTNYDGSSGVTSYSGLAAELEKATGMKINFIDLSDPSADQLPDLYNTLYANLSSGNPILFSSNSGTSAKMRDIISSNAEHAAAGTYSNTPMHGVLLAGLYKDKNGNEFVVIDNPNTGRATRDGTSNQFYSVPLEYFKNAVLSSPKYDIHRVVVFDKSGIKDPASYYESLLEGSKHDSAAHDKLIQIFGADADKYSSYDEFMKNKYSDTSLTSNNISNVSGSASSASTTTTNTTITDLRQKTDASSISEWIGNIAEKFTQFGSNIITAILSGDPSKLFIGSSSTASTTYTSGGSGSNATSGSYDVSQAKSVVIDAAYVQSLVNNAYSSYNNNSDINMELSKNGYGMYQINASNYSKITSNPGYSTLTTLIASSTNYKKYVADTFSAIYTWILVLQVAEIVKSKKAYNKDDKQLFAQYKAMINHTSGTSSIDALNAFISKFGKDAVKYETYEDYLMDITSDSKYLSSTNNYSTQIDSKAASLYNKLSTMQLFAVGTPTDDYTIIPDWAKTSAGSGIPSAGNEVDTLHYLMDLMTKAETGGDINNPNDIDKMYFNPIWLNGESNVTIGRGGFYNTNAKTVFSTAAKSPSLSETTRGVMQSIASQISNHSIKPAEIKSFIEQYPDMKPALITAQDAMMNEFAWDYISRAANQYNSKGMKDPRSIILGAEFAGVAPNTVPSFYSAVTSPGASDELNQVRQGMFNTIAGFGNYGKYGKGWKNRINGMYSMITSEGNGKNPWNGVYLPLPQHIIDSIPSNMDLIPTSIGYGDAGYNMRDGIHMYTDDIYMGDSDNPMHVVLDQSPVTSRIDKLIELVDSAVNAKHETVAGTSDAISSSIGTGPAKSTIAKTNYTKGSSSTAQSDRLAEIHNKIAKRTRVSLNYNHM